MVDQDSPQGTLVEFSLLVKWGRWAQVHTPALSHPRRQEVNWVLPNLFVSLTLAGSGAYAWRARGKRCL